MSRGDAGVGFLDAASESVRTAQPLGVRGRVAAIRGLTIEAEHLPLPVGALVRVHRQEASRADEEGVRGEVVGASGDRSILMLLGSTSGVRIGDSVVGEQARQSVRVGDRLLGRVINGLGEPIDGLGSVPETVWRPIDPEPVAALRRGRIDRPLATGVRAIDGMLTVGRGQRLGVFAGPGVGKSTLLAQIAVRASADVNVIALIGERGREVSEFISDVLGEEGLSRSVVVVATGDESPLLRIRASLLAHAVAEHFRDAGRDVMLMMDSVTRYAHAQRQVGLSVGEPPATKGYTPSVFAGLSRLLERAGVVKGPAGNGSGGSITGLYTVLVEGDDMTEPVADATRGILDGHLILSRKLVQKGQFPAVDVLDSVSRVADAVSDATHQAARTQVRRMMASYASVEELIQIGAYAQGSDPEADVAVAFWPRVRALLMQGRGDVSEFADTQRQLVQIAMESSDLLRRVLEQQGRSA